MIPGALQKAILMVPESPPHPRVSVCMAAYNGANHIAEQISSILPELGEHDELIIVDDHSTDNTTDIILGFEDGRIRLLETDVNAGYVRTFERALGEARGDFVFLSDQDDVWMPGRVEEMIGALGGNHMVVSNCEHFDGPAGRFHEIRLRTKDSRHRVRNIIGILVGYRLHWGCAMAFRQQILGQILPFPPHMNESHDQWIALVGNMNKSITYLETNTILHRLHGKNLTPAGLRRPSKILKARIAFAKNIVIAWHRRRNAAAL